MLLDTDVTNISGSAGKFTVSFKTGKKTGKLNTGAVILAAGIEAFNPLEHEIYSYGRLPNVITSIEYEQMQKPLGPQKGFPKRPSDGKPPQKIAWLQCVGSRDINQCDAPYCSSVCCMYALKEAVNTKDINEEIETTIFYMDMRTHGKGHEEYLTEAVSKGVQLIRSRVHTIEQVAGTEDLSISYAAENGEIKNEIYDMVVLSVGVKPSGEAIELGRKIGIEINEDLFLAPEPFRPAATNIPGIFMCGGIGGPHDISQSIIQATSTLTEITDILEPKSFQALKKYPKIAETGDEPSILLAYNLCSGMDSSVGTQIKESVKKTSGVKKVVKVQGDILEKLTEQMKVSGANRLVFAGCSPIVHKNLIEEALRRAGINPYLYEMVDLRLIGPEDSSAQINDRIRMGIARVALISPPALREIPVQKQALVVGGGVAGLESALSISKQGYPVTLVEKEKKLGGNSLHVKATWQGNNVKSYLNKLVSSVKKGKNITILTEASVKECSGFCGNFTTTLVHKGKDITISHGAVVLAPGGEASVTDEYLYGKSNRVLLWPEMGRRMLEEPSSLEKAGSVAFIQCVGSREPDRPYCSNLCCSFAVRSAVDLKKKNPEMDVYILFREMRTFGQRESLYREARSLGVIFIRYDLENKPVVEQDTGTKKLKVTVTEPILEKQISFTADYISLQTAIVGSDNSGLSEIFKVNLDENGFFAESPEKMKPVDTTGEGIYVAGLASYPKETAETISQARAASARALEILNQDTVQIGGMVAEVRAEKCAVCCTCVRTCPFNVPFIDSERGAAYIDPGLCRGCGMCVAECPGKAIVMSACSDQMLEQIPAVLLKAS